MPRLNTITTKPPAHHATPFAEVQPGQWFNTHSGENMFPFMKLDNGSYFSPANGHYVTPDMNCYREVWVLPVGTRITIEVGTRDA
jgi:hypothetical protein